MEYGLGHKPNSSNCKRWERSLNPCLGGIWSWTQWQVVPNRHRKSALILVRVEYGLGHIYSFPYYYEMTEVS